MIKENLALVILLVVIFLPEIQYLFDVFLELQVWCQVNHSNNRSCNQKRGHGCPTDFVLDFQNTLVSSNTQFERTVIKFYTTKTCHMWTYK